ncbi:MAG: hypothetical protein H7839_17250 [Magnetococcus sp. YQC-5]
MLASVGLHIDQAPPLHLPFRFFGAALVFALLTGFGLLFWGNELLIAPLLPVTVATVHGAVLGWLLMSVMGAMIQMIPVLAGIPVPWPQGVPWIHGIFISGVVCMGLGLVTGHTWILLSAMVGLGMALFGFLVPIALALIRAPAKHPTVNAMRMAMMALTGTVLLGVLFLGEYAHGFLDLDRHTLVGIHLTWGLLGCMGSLIIGVSWQVLPMFYMTPAFPSGSASWILRGMGIFLLVMPMALVWSSLEDPWMLYVASLPGLGAMGWYGIETYRMMSQRKRTFADATLRFWQLGFVCGVMALCLLMLWPLVSDERLRFLFGILYAVGWVGSIITGMLHKIIPFLVWFHRFSPAAGLQEIPMMDDLSPSRVVNVQVYVHAGSIVILSMGVVTGWDWAVRFGGVGLMVVAGVSLYALWFALRIKPPEIPVMPDFASFFKPPA